MRRFVNWMLILAVAVFIAGCGGSGSGSGGKYSLTNGSNSAVLGPLEGATVKVFELGDINKSIETTDTGAYGAFSLALKEIPDNEILLVSVSGGKDIDANDDGIVDKTPTPNKGTIHAFASAGDLKNGKINVSIISEIIYQQLKTMLSNIGDYKTGDFQNILNGASSLLVKSTDLNSSYNTVTGFDPISNKDKLKFDYTKLLNGTDSLIDMYHNDENKSKIINRISSLFPKNKLGFHGNLIKKLKVNEKVTFAISNDANYTASNIKFDSNGTGFVRKDSNISVAITNVKDGYKILSWSGCDIVSSDLKKCSVYNIDSDKLISVNVVPKIEVKSGIVIRDITNAYVSIDKNSSTATDQNMTVYADISDKNTSDILASMKVGDILVHKSIPVFFGKLTKKTEINKFRYNLLVKKIPLEDVISKGYISTSSKIGSVGSTSGSRVISRYVVLPNGKSMTFDPNKPAKLTINFGKNKQSQYTIDGRSVELSATFDGLTAPYKNKKLFGDDVDISGSISIEPKFDFNVNWSFFGGLHAFSLSDGVDISNNVTINITKEFKKDDNITLKTLEFGQVVMVGPIPVVLTEPIKIYVGANIDAGFKGEIGASSTIVPTIAVGWNNKIGAYVKPSFEHSAEAHVSLEGHINTFAYIGVDPAFMIYGLGGHIDNKFGPYCDISGEATDSKVSDDSGTKYKVAAGLSGEIGLEYIGTIGFTSTWSVLDDAIGKINDKLPNKGEISHKWPIKTISASTETESSKKPGNIEVTSPNKLVKIKTDDAGSIYKELTYTLKNTGGEDIYWNIKKKSDGVDIELSKENGVLKPGDSYELTADISGRDGLSVGIYNSSISIYESYIKPASSYSPYRPSKFIDTLLNVPIFISSIDVTIEPKSLDLDKTTLNLGITGTSIKKLSFTWDTKVGYSVLDGYKIYKSDYNATTDSCPSYTPFAEINGRKTEIEKNLLPLRDLNTSEGMDSNKTYCFMLTGYKNHTSKDGRIFTKEYTLVDKPAKIMPFPVVVSHDDNGTVTTGGELDVMFLVDMSGSYGGFLSTFKSSSKDIVKSLKEKLPKGMTLKVGLSSFDDYPPSAGYPDDTGSDDYAYKLEQGLDSNTSKFISAVDNNLSVKYGGDVPEAQLEGLYQDATSPKIGWSKGAVKMILLFTDASFHDSDRDSAYPGHGSSEVKAALKANNISVIGMASRGITDDMKNISDWTFLLSGYDASSAINKILNVVSAIPGTKVISRSILPRDLDSDSYTPGGYMGRPNN